LLAAAEKISRFIEGAMIGELGKVVKLVAENKPSREAHA
jgi:hypothetical protein